MTTHIVVLGAGYSGLVAAKRAARLPDTRVTLVNAAAEFVERVRLHEVAAGRPVRSHRITELIGRAPVELVVDTVTAIDPDRKVVTLANGTLESNTLDYDTLVYALGSRADVEVEHVHPLALAPDAERLKRELRGTVAVVGGGLTGVEAATEFAEAGHPVRLLTAGPLGAALSAKGRAHLRRVLDRLEVQVHDQVKVTGTDATGLTLADGGYVPADTVVWTTGFRAPALAADSGFAVDDRGRMVVDGTLRSVSHPDVYAVGDAAAVRLVNGLELRMACATGLPAGYHAAKAIGDRLAGREPGPLSFRFVNQCVSLGRKDGLIQFVRADDTPVERVLTGRLAAWYKELIVRGALFAQRHPALAGVSPRGGTKPRP
ncbi:FAD-dependent oxidoreductase [Actinokineospora sp. NBRC 105648]|uniref:NAD(P)/FAD-dependent oxidoreductase n=1 Tax=Actinokineospora sp. NBRC 105648 TaxID=3032206 RepID=UPI0024A0512C|nr:FAD-dependent oxidoreductase [Actinokineospora sp. NBRC 105648]GLZ39486.1 oxidoreductase [Actinokineospora sp. NBRC 105648]